MNAALLQALESGKDLNTAIEEATAPMRQVIGQFLQAQPFQPFRLSLTSGSVYEIRTPVGVELRPTTLDISTPNAAGTLEWRSTLALIHVVTLEPLFADEPTIVADPNHEGCS